MKGGRGGEKMVPAPTRREREGGGRLALLRFPPCGGGNVGSEGDKQGEEDLLLAWGKRGERAKFLALRS